MKKLSGRASVYEAIVWALEELAPEIPKGQEPTGDLKIVVDYQEVLDRKHQLLRDVFLGDAYENAQREAKGVAKDTKRLGKGEQT